MAPTATGWEPDPAAAPAVDSAGVAPAASSGAPEVEHESVPFDESGEGLSAIPPVEPEAPSASVHSHAEAQAAEAPKSVVAATGVVETTPFLVAGVTWEDPGLGSEDVAVWIRTRTAGEWSEWQVLGPDVDGPDAGTEPANRARGGTAPLITAGADAVEARVATADGDVPLGIAVDVFAPVEGASAQDSATQGRPDFRDVVYRPQAQTAAVVTDIPPVDTDDATHQAMSMQPAAVSRPDIRTRAQWGADESKMTWSPRTGRVQGIVVHHTAGTNSYTQAQVPGIIRGIYHYHAVTRGWGDIGYNFLVDRFGTVWEGRYGGMERAIVAAHATGYNSWTAGVSVLGNFDSAQPTAASLKSVAEVAAWKLAVHGVASVWGTVTFPNGRTVNAISGHRNVGSTSCPGTHLYGQLHRIRTLADEASVDRVPISSTLRLTGPGQVLNGAKATLTATWHTTGGQPVAGPLRLQRQTASGWTDVAQDRTTDGRATFTVDPGTGTTYRLVQGSGTTSPADVQATGASNAVTVDVATSSSVTLSAPARAVEGSDVDVSVSWRTAGGAPVDGLVALQRNDGNGWEHEKFITVRAGVGTGTYTVRGTSDIRVRTRDGDGVLVGTYSKPVTVEGLRTTVVRLTGPSSAEPGSTPQLSLRWQTAADTPLEGLVALQRNEGDGWKHERFVEVVDGTAQVTVRLADSADFRVRTVQGTAVVVGTYSAVHTIEAREGSTVTLSVPPSGMVGAEAGASVTWQTASGAPVDGVVALQRRAGSTWEHLGFIEVVSGRGTITFTIDRTRVLRVRTWRADSVVVGTYSPQAVITGLRETTTTLSGPSSAAPGSTIDLAITWRTTDAAALDGLVSLQRYDAAGWRHVQYVTVTAGEARTTVRLDEPASFRIRTHRGSAVVVGTYSNVVEVSEAVAPTVTLDAPGAAVAGTDVTVTTSWHARGGDPVDGQVALQGNTGDGWQHLGFVRIVDGNGAGTFRLERDTHLRIRTHSATSHSTTEAPVGSYSTSARVHATAPASFNIEGAGWGHGVGMSQYGAYGQALQGASAADILTHYYTGTQLTPWDRGGNIRVQLLGGVDRTSITPRGGQATISIDGRRITGDAPILLTATTSNGVPAVRIQAGAADLVTTRQLRIEWPGTAFLQPDGDVTTVSVTGADAGTAAGTYRHGRLLISNRGGAVNVVNELRFHDHYLYGVAEMPSSWPAAALQAQAIAARTYAARHLAEPLKSDCECHVYDEVRSQKFTGWAKESEATWGQRWVAAVDATTVFAEGRPAAGQVVTAAGQVIEAVYSSSSGGRTQASEDVWGSSRSYLRSVADPWSAHARNPYATWTFVAGQRAVARAFGLTEVLTVRVTDRTAAGAVKTIQATGADREVKTLSGEQLRARLGLRSTYVTGFRPH